MNEFIKKLIEKFLMELKKCEASHSFGEAWGMKCAINITQELAEEYKGGWISCDENLPNHNQAVIFQTEDGMVETGYYDVNEDWCVNDSYFPNAFRFIAWQPLPDPYIEK